MEAGWDDLLSLEDQFYQEGHALGLADGRRAGRHEGRSFGVSKACEKFTELGLLHGRAEVLQARLKQAGSQTHGHSQSQSRDQENDKSSSLSALASSERLHRHFDRLLELTRIENLSPENSEEAVAELDETLREARSKATLISKSTGVDLLRGHSSADTSTSRGTQGELEDFQARTRFDM